MTIQEIMTAGGPLAAAAENFVKTAAVFIGELSKNNLSLDLGPANNTDNVIDYDAPASDSYKRTYAPITAEEIILANKKMAEAISGERFIDGFIACVQLMMMFGGAA